MLHSSLLPSIDRNTKWKEHTSRNKIIDFSFVSFNCGDLAEKKLNGLKTFKRPVQGSHIHTI